MTKKLSVYSTEVVAVAREFTAYAPAIPGTAEEFSASAITNGTASEMAAPAGFSKVTEFSWSNGDFVSSGRFNGDDLSGYTDIYFAMKLVNGNGYYVQGCAMYYGEYWVYVHLERQESGAWTKTLTSEDGYTSQQTGLAYNKLSDLLKWVSGKNNGSYPKSHSKDLGITATAYFTEVLAVKPVSEER